MGATKRELEETIEALRAELLDEIARGERLREENRRLCEALGHASELIESMSVRFVQMSARYGRLEDYVKRLRDWAGERARLTGTWGT